MPSCAALRAGLNILRMHPPGNSREQHWFPEHGFDFGEHDWDSKKTKWEQRSEGNNFIHPLLGISHSTHLT
jgi:hypothetical protein